MFHLIYHSQALSCSDQDLNEILKVSKNFNSANDITGLLLLRDFYFLQLLEGDELAVRRLLDKIKTDRRHRDIQVIAEANSNSRMMDSWSMALVDSAALASSAEGLLNIFELAREKDKMFSTKSELEVVMRLFALKSRQLILR